MEVMSSIDRRPVDSGARLRPLRHLPPADARLVALLKEVDTEFEFVDNMSLSHEDYVEAVLDLDQVSAWFHYDPYSFLRHFRALRRDRILPRFRVTQRAGVPARIDDMGSVQPGSALTITEVVGSGVETVSESSASPSYDAAGPFRLAKAASQWFTRVGQGIFKQPVN